MNTRAVFALSTLMSFLSSGIVAALFVWPGLRNIGHQQALLWLVAPHMFLRFIGLSFIVPGVVGMTLPKNWAVPAAWGDFGAGVMAIVASVGLASRAGWALAAVWVFNLWGAGDLLFAFFQGGRIRLDPSALGAGFYIVTAIVPPLLVSHALVFGLLLRG